MFFQILHHFRPCEEYPTKEALGPLRRASDAYYALAGSTDKLERGLDYIFNKLRSGELKVMITKNFSARGIRGRSSVSGIERADRARGRHGLSYRIYIHLSFEKNRI
jgi:hypothetical protein